MAYRLAQYKAMEECGKYGQFSTLPAPANNPFTTLPGDASNPWMNVTQPVDSRRNPLSKLFNRNPASFAPAPTAAPRQQFQQTFQQPQQFAAPATEAPRNFFPPGQLQLNRFENGFNFDFTSQ